MNAKYARLSYFSFDKQTIKVGNGLLLTLPTRSRKTQCWY